MTTEDPIPTDAEGEHSQYLPNPVFAMKLTDLFGQGYRSAGVLLSNQAEPERLVGITQAGKVIWWPQSSPEPDEMVRMIIDWVNGDVAERSLTGAILHMGMALGTISRLRQELRLARIDVDNNKRLADALIERTIGED